VRSKGSPSIREVLTEVLRHVRAAVGRENWSDGVLTRPGIHESWDGSCPRWALENGCFSEAHNPGLRLVGKKLEVIECSPDRRNLSWDGSCPRGALQNGSFLCPSAFHCFPPRPWLSFARKNTSMRKGVRMAKEGQAGASFLEDASDEQECQRGRPQQWSVSFRYSEPTPTKWKQCTVSKKLESPRAASDRVRTNPTR